MAAAAKILAVGDMFEAARKAFFSAEETRPPDTLPKSREIVFTEEVPAESESDAKSRSAATKGSHAAVLVHA